MERNRDPGAWNPYLAGALAGLVLSIPYGLSASASVHRPPLSVAPAMWQQRLGGGVVKRGLVAFVGGTIEMFGARLTDG